MRILKLSHTAENVGPLGFFLIQFVSKISKKEAFEDIKKFSKKVSQFCKK